MKILNKTTLAPKLALPIALSIALLSTVSSLSTLAQEIDEKVTLHKIHQAQEININVDSDGTDAIIFVNIDGEITKIKLPVESLNDPAKLTEALADVPEDIREKLLTTMGNLHHDSSEQKVTWVSDSDSDSDEKHIIVIKDENGDIQKEMKFEVITDMDNSGGHNMMKLAHKGQVSADMIIRLMSHGDFSADDLNKIQQALDAKR